MSSEWPIGIASAYELGLSDAKARRAPDASRANGFDAAYHQGYEHGAAMCMGAKRIGEHLYYCHLPAYHGDSCHFVHPV